MFGEPSDEETECNARLFISDNYGDGSATIRCQLAPNHEGLHQEQFERRGHMVTITWVADERERCDHGCGQWRHDHDRYNDGGDEAKSGQLQEERLRCPKYADDHEFSDCAYCHPDEPAQLCALCGKTYYYETGHKRHCAKEPYTCAVCGESGIGPHVWPICPKERAAFIASAPDFDDATDGTAADFVKTQGQDP